jgi:uncharacterized protein
MNMLFSHNTGARDQIHGLIKSEEKKDNTKAVLRKCALGKGVFAVNNMQIGEFVAGFNGHIYTAGKASLLSASIRNHAVQFSPNLWRDSVGIARFLNHSCEPNCRISGDFDVITIGSIKAGEELTWDYSTTENSDWVVPGGRCLCGSTKCRDTIPPYRDLSISEKMAIAHRIASWLRR